MRKVRIVLKQLMGILVVLATVIGGAANTRAAGLTHTYASGTTWNSADWGVNGVPNAAGDIATNNVNATTNMSLDVDVTIGQITKSNGAIWGIQGTDHTLTLNNAGGVANVYGTSEAAISNNSGSGTLSITPDVKTVGDLIIGTNGGTGGVSISGTIYSDNNVTLYLRANSNNAAVTVIQLGGAIGPATSNGTVSISNVGSNTGVVTISAQLGSKVGTITQSSATSPLTLSGNNAAFTGGVSLQAGTLKLGSANALGAAASTLTISDGTTLDALSGGATITPANQIVVNGNFAFGATGALTFTSNAVSLGTAAGTTRTITASGTTTALTFGGVISNGTTANSLTKAGTGTVVIQGANTTANGGYTGATNVTGGTLTISGASGAITSSTSISASGGGTLNLDNTAGNVDRITDSLGVTLTAGGLTLVGNASANTTETIGTLSIGAGQSTVTITNGTATRITTLAASGFSRTGSGTATITGTNLGQTQTSPNFNTARLTLGTLNNNVPSGLTVVGSSTSSSGVSTGSVKSLTVVPYLFGNNGTNYGFLTYDTTSGLRVLGTTEYTNFSGNYPTQANQATPENVQDNGTVSSSAAIIVNSLLIQSGNSALTGGGGALTINSGAILDRKTQSLTLSNFSQITLGNGTWNEGVIALMGGGDLTISSALDVSGNGGLTKTGSGNLKLTTANLYAGATNVNQGTLTIGNGTAGNLAAASGTVTVSSGATLALNQANGTTFANTVSNNGTFTDTVAASGSHTLSGTISNAGSMTFTLGNNATQTVSGNITSSGSITMSLGTGAAQTLSGNINSTGTITLTLGSGSTETISGSISGTSSITQGNANTTIVFSGSNNTYSGTTTISAGTVRAGSTGALSANSAYTMTGTATLDLNGYSNSVGSLSAFTTNTISLGAGTLTLGALNTSTTINTAISGSGGLTKTGTGTLTLQNANTYRGLTTVSQGTLTLDNSLGLGAMVAGNVSVANNATMTFAYGSSTASIALPGAVSGAGGVALTATTTGSFSVTLVNSSFSGPITYSTGSALPAFVLASSSVNQTISGGISSTSGSALFVKTGKSTLTLSGTSGTGFGSRLAGGTVVLDFTNGVNTSRLSSLNTLHLGGTTISLSGGSGFTQNVSSTTFLLGGGNNVINQTNGGSNKIALATLSGVAGSTLNIAGDNIATSNAGAGFISARYTWGSGSSMRYANSGTGGAVNGYTGGTTVTDVNSIGNSGTNYDASAFTNTTFTNARTGSTLRYTGGAVNFDMGSSGTFNLTLAGIMNVGGTMTFSRSGTSTAAVTASSELILTGTGDMVFNVPVMPTSGPLTMSSSGTVTLAATNSYVGATYLNAGTLSVSSNNNLGETTQQLYVNGGTLRATADMALDNGGASLRTVNLGGNGGTFEVAGTKTLTIAGTVVNTTLISGTPNIFAFGGLTKTGLGKLTLSNAANTYSDATQIKAGTLALVTSGNNNISTSRSIVVGTNASESSATLDLSGVSGAGGFQIAAGQSLAGHGSVVGGAVTALSGSTIAPGNSTGTLTIAGDVTLNSGSNFSIEVNGKTTAGTDYDQLVISGDHTASLGGNLVVSMGTFSTTLGDRIYILNNAGSGATSGTFSGLGEGARVTSLEGVNGFGWTITYAGIFGSPGSGTNDVALVAVVTPEPAGLGLITLVGTALLRRRRSR